MLIIKKTDSRFLRLLAAELRAGAVIVYPTDTAYALGCDATNKQAVAKIFKIKGRNEGKALPLIVADLKMAKKFFSLSFGRRPESKHHRLVGRYGLDPRLREGDKKVLLLTKKYWPGPLSIVLKAKPMVAGAVLKNGTAAVRVPGSRLARELSRLLGRPLVATSANMSGQSACYSVAAYLKQIKGNHEPFATRHAPDIVLDAGALLCRKPSTIVAIREDGTIIVLRQGPVRLSDAR